ncbi:MAG TPA: ABC transporter ATP-binding protein, partial [Desulfobacterales bacterium]|nr:ABC transporter ATP-binding protein [Desulfobacterales bacterium]
MIPDRGPSRHSSKLWGFPEMALDRLRRMLSSIPNVGRTILFVVVVSWKAAPVHIMAWGLLTTASALIPIGMVVVTKLIVDAVVSAIRSPNLSNDFRTILLFIGLELVLALLQKVLGNLDTVLTRILDDRSTLYIGTLTFEQSIRLDVSYYQQSDFFDKMRLAQVDGSSGCIESFRFLVVLMQRLLTFGGLLALFLRLNGLLMLVLTVTMLPSLIIDLRYSFRRYHTQRLWSPTARRADYVADLLIGGAYAKEVRLFGLGRYLINLWRSIQTQLHRKTIRISYRGAAMKSAASAVSLLGFYGCYGY